ncbi:MAG: AAA family ATPase [Nanoarchaeota archaeon]|nr:AAA family ATPase [Nanoarchaeota archaeon]MCG2718895.1 AAA family ATPase [Nanoarchaeota archaeon]
MIIDYIKLKNYRQYRDQTVNLGAGEKGKNIVIIEGRNGAGKTNILNAITWCLYGQEFHISKSEGLPIVNTSALNDLGVNEKTTVEVEIQLISNDKNKRYKIKRTVWIQKSEKDDAEQISDRYLSNQSDGTKLEVFVQIGKDIKGEFRDPAHIVQRLLPEKINEYFLFDGERLDNYFKEESGGIIKEAVFKISQLDLLDRMIDHLNKTKDEFLRSSEGLTPEIKELEEKKTALLDSLEKMKNELGKQSNAKKEAKEHRNEIDKKLRESPRNIKKLAEEREGLEQDLLKLESELEEERKNRSDYLIEMSPLILTHEAINQSWRIISKQEEAGKIPPPIAKNFLERLLEKGVCICGTDISKKNEYRKNVELFLQSCKDIGNISGEIIELCGYLRGLIDESSDFRKKQIMYGKRVEDLEEREKKNNERLKRIEEEIKGCDVKEIKRLEEKLEEYNNEISNVDQKIGEIKVKIDNMKDERLVQIDRDLNKELKKEEKFQELRRILSFCNSVLDIANKIKTEIMGEIREEIEEKTKKQFFDIIWKKVTYKEVKIDDNYNFLVLDQTGRKALGTLSAGERESLALSFMAALNTVSGFDVPIVIDTPLARIDTEERQDIARSLPEYFKDTQVVILVTGAEYTPAVRKSLSKNVCKEYKIKFEEYKKGSEAKVVSYEK